MSEQYLNYQMKPCKFKTYQEIDEFVKSVVMLSDLKTRTSFRNLKMIFYSRETDKLIRFSELYRLDFFDSYPVEISFKCLSRIDELLIYIYTDHKYSIMFSTQCNPIDIYLLFGIVVIANVTPIRQDWKNQKWNVYQNVRYGEEVRWRNICEKIPLDINLDIDTRKKRVSDLLEVSFEM